MANFELIGFVKSTMYVGSRSRVTIAEYVQGKRSEDGSIENEKMDLWAVFFPASSRKHIARFKPNDLVIVKGTIHQSANEEYKYAINGECIKHFYTRNMLDEIKREKVVGDESPDIESYLTSDF